MVSIYHTLNNNAANYGFVATAITSPNLVGQWHSDLLKWSQTVTETPLPYLFRQKETKSQPQTWREDITSIILTFTPYPNIQSPIKLARYAWRKDYHEIIKQKLEAWWSDTLLQHNEKAIAYPFVDSAPLPEVALAAQAGLGFKGKHGLIINPKWGSFGHLSGLATNLPLPDSSDTKLPNCGTCTRCIDACPTKAISPNGGINPNLCISTWTIEKKGPWPDNHFMFDVPAQDRSLFGCDICQDVCPWNTKTPPIPMSSISNFDHPLPASEEELNIALQTRFKKTFSNTPILRTGKANLLRNLEWVTINSIDKN